MTPRERERRVAAVARRRYESEAGDQWEAASQVARVYYCEEAAADLDAADEAVPMVSVDALLADDAAMLALSEAAWEHAGTAMPRSAEGGREGLRAALASFSGEEGTEGQDVPCGDAE